MNTYIVFKFKCFQSYAAAGTTVTIVVVLFGNDPIGPFIAINRPVLLIEEAVCEILLFILFTIVVESIDDDNNG
ncbi:hypothetical protein DERF_004641 [Dermatophagoides farinae]|uniref:Uncharacterized protein n=1 Tax=Dermatophagoides farinae TaxID=6954 RepID=A0A922I2S5_DERFA|nr:hypothetical protein DERF_004641 [Dermatophagoides farinae]